VVGRVSSPQFIGRRDELAALGAALARAEQGSGSVVLVAGEAGMGKSRLISELAGRAAATGMTVIVGECLPLGEGELPYAPIVGALRSLVRQREASELDALLRPAHEDLVTLLPELSFTGDGLQDFSGEGSQGRLFEQLLTLLATAAREAPLVLVVEDFQWADRSTRDFLSFLVRAARREPIALIVSYRSDELQRRHPLRPFVLELERSGRAIRVELGRFTRTELSEQIAAILDQPPPPPLVDRLLERSGGNPFFTEELLASSHAASEPLPASLRDTLLARVEAHPTRVRDVLRIAAVTGRTVDHALLAAVARLPEDDLNGALRDAVDDYLLAHDPATAGYSFRHALLREAIYSDLLPGERRILHLRLARTLGENPRLAGTTVTAAAEVAHHWHAAGELPAALAASISAGAAAEDVHAMGEALLHYERALEIWDLVGPAPGELQFERLEVMRRAGEAALLTGETQRAIALTRELLARIDEQSDSTRAALAHERLGRYLWTAGRPDDALPEYRRAVELMPVVPPSEERALVLAAEGQVLMLCNRHAESRDPCEQALTIARAVGAEAVEAHVLNTICGNLSGVGDYGKAVAAAKEALGIARRRRLRGEMLRSYANGSDALDEAGLIAESIAMAREGISSAREFGSDRNLGDFLRGEVAGRLFRSGRWGEADQLLEEVIARGLTGVNAGIAYLHLGELLAERGEFEAARRALDQADGHVTGSAGAMWLGPPAAARASLELWAGHPETAAVLVATYLQRVADGQPVFFSARVYELGARACADLAALAPGDVNTCQQQAAQSQILLERLDELIEQLTAVAPPLVSASRAACAAECSRVSRGADPALWADAQRHWEACKNRYCAAYAGWRGAEALLVAGGDRGAAEALMREAHAVAEDLGAQPLREALEGLARRARIDLRDQRTDEAALNAPLQRLELTPRELEVLALLADGLTNREIATKLFISHKTASVHVSRILSKLSVPNRAAAATAAYTLGVKPSAPFSE
jgi:DNA-binding CsgD family transcriptional regulator